MPKNLNRQGPSVEELQNQTQEIFDLMLDPSKLLMKQEEALNKMRLSHAKELFDLQIDLANKKATLEEKQLHELNKKYLKAGATLQEIEAHNKRKLAAETLVQSIKQKKEQLKEAAKEDRKALKEKIKAETKELKKADQERRKENKKLDAIDRKEKAKKDSEALNAIMSTISKVGLGSTKKAREQLTELGITDEAEQNKYIKAAKADAAYKAFANFAKELEGTAKDIAEAQSEIETRLQGSKNSKGWDGLYWTGMVDKINTGIGMSPFLKQADAVNNLKTLVGQGISFNVEQRAFLDTISEKIATTFEATDASLLKLVRIQQADSTAARLGMESALTSFLNNMYETTEYMTEAASSIRQSIYEASALMTAEEATEFEYQVQKWMGSLYSVGFNSTQGLADALGQLAAGDISGITNGGYGNLLVMAANKANLSIADILAGGLDESNTNDLMKAMVEYLSGIYEETKDNKVVAQQFANVYGLTASDLKAAANLASSTTNVYKQNKDYGDLMQQLVSMANTMHERTAIGTMVNNVLENLKYSTASTIGSNPVLYTMYTVASMLDDTVGGISIPSIGAWAMGNGTEIDLETTVADIMRTGAMAGGLLGGIGKAIVGLAQGGGSGEGMLKLFGVNTSASSASTVLRGAGDGTTVTSSGATSALSGFVGNMDGDSVANKALTDEKDKANKQAAQALDEAAEIGMANIDEHVVQIYTLLNEVVTGSRNFHVVFNDAGSWSNNGFTPSGVPML